MFYIVLKPITFSKQLGIFFQGKRPHLTTGRRPIDKSVSLADIYAVQLLRKRCSGNKSSYYCYEINLVLRNKERRHVLVTGSLKAVRQDTKILSEFLGVPLWDGVPE